MAKTENVESIEIPQIDPKIAYITIIGDSDLVLNKMDDVTARELIDARKDKAKSLDKPNKWEKIITSIHWRDGKPKVFTEESLYDALEHNAPCITSFGLKKSLGEAVVRNEISKYSTKFDACVNFMAPGGLIPIKFTEYHQDEMLMSPKKGAPVLVTLNRFSGWSATFAINYIEKAYSLAQIVNIINLAGFGIGIGSGRRSSGNGRYHVVDVK